MKRRKTARNVVRRADTEVAERILAAREAMFSRRVLGGAARIGESIFQFRWSARGDKGGFEESGAVGER